MFTITEDAAAAVQAVLSAEDVPENGGLRFSAGGEDQLEMALAPEPADGDQVVEEHGARLFLDADAAAALDEMQLDVEVHGDHLHFNVRPQEAA